MTSRFRGELGRLLVQLPTGQSPAPLIAEIERAGATIESIEISHEADRRTVDVTVELPKAGLEPGLVAQIADLEHILEVRWQD